DGIRDSPVTGVQTCALPISRWLEPHIKAKLARWFWCGVLGELYGGAVETRIALDVQQLLAWIDDPAAPEPATVQAAGFNPNRLEDRKSVGEGKGRARAHGSR